MLQRLDKYAGTRSVPAHFRSNIRQKIYPEKFLLHHSIRFEILGWVDLVDVGPILLLRKGQGPYVPYSETIPLDHQHLFLARCADFTNTELALQVIEMAKSTAARKFWEKYKMHMPITCDTIAKWKKSLETNNAVYKMGTARQNKKLQGPRLSERVLCQIKTNTLKSLCDWLMPSKSIFD